MNISSLSINRPVLASVLSITLVLFGIIGFKSLGIREYPSVDPPVITVTTNYTGANADVIESQITEPLEEQINGVAGIRTLSSISSDGRSTVTVEFNLGTDLETAANDVRDKVSQAVRNLPADADPPIVTKSDADAQTILSITIQSDSRSLLNLTKYGNDVFKEQLQTIPGVSSIHIWGEKKFAMKLMLDPRKMAAYDITPLDVKNALDKQNVELPSGDLEGFSTDLTIRTFGRLTTPEDFNNMLITQRNGTLIRLKDVGTAELRPENERTLLRGNGGIPMIGIALTPQPGSNYIDIVDQAFKKVDQMKKDLPSDLHLGVALDSTETIRKAITEVEETILIAFILVLLVIFAFLRDWRTTLIPIIAIPISLISTFFVMYVADFSINILTLLGVVLATGLVVDDAIVVLENIYSKVEKGIPPMQAAREGSKEIYFAIISTTITLAAVFLPIIFLQGITGRLFREFGIVVASAVLISAFVSLTLTPMMSSRLLRKKESESAFFKKSEAFIVGMIDRYNRSLRKFMAQPIWAFVIMAGSIAMIFGFGSQLHSELAPLEDKSSLRIISTAPEGTTFDRMDEYVSRLVAFTDTMPEKKSLLAVTSPNFGSSTSSNSAFLFLTLKPPGKRDKTQMQLANELTQKLKKYNFARSFVVQQPTIGSGHLNGLPVEYVIEAQNLEKLKAVLPKFMAKAQADSVFSVVDLNLKFTKPELKVSINREKAQQMGVSAQDIAQTLQLYFSGQRFGYFIMDGKQYQVIGEAKRNDRNDPTDLKFLTVRNKDGDIVPLDNLVSLSMESSPPQLFRYNRFVSATVSAGLAQGMTIGQGIDEMDKIAKSTLDQSFSTALSGQSKDFAESSNSLWFAFGLALVLIYLVLSAQFESFRDPLIIMLTVPLAIAGALFSLWLGNHTLNIFSEIGIIVLIGIVTKNGILIVEFANQRKDHGLSVKEAAIDAATQRIRPILMTSLATVLGAVPIALALGAASTSRIPMGIAVIGGLLFSLVLTLYVIPSLYAFISSKKSRKPVE